MIIIRNIQNSDNLEKLIMLHAMLDQIEYLTMVDRHIRVICPNDQIENLQFEWMCKRCGKWNSEPLVDNQGNDYCSNCDVI